VDLVERRVHERDQVDDQPSSLRLVPPGRRSEFLLGLGEDTQRPHVRPSLFRMRGACFGGLLTLAMIAEAS
jgi:hypothetical protein